MQFLFTSLFIEPFRHRAKFGDLTYADLHFQRIKAKMRAVIVGGNHTLLFADTVFTVKDFLTVFAENTSFLIIYLFLHFHPSFLFILHEEILFYKSFCKKDAPTAIRREKNILPKRYDL